MVFALTLKWFKTKFRDHLHSCTNLSRIRILPPIYTMLFLCFVCLEPLEEFISQQSKILTPLLHGQVLLLAHSQIHLTNLQIEELEMLDSPGHVLCGIIPCRFKGDIHWEPTYESGAKGNMAKWSHKVSSSNPSLVRKVAWAGYISSQWNGDKKIYLKGQAWGLKDIFVCEMCRTW